MAMSLTLLLVSELILGEPLTNPDALEDYLATTEIPTIVAFYAHATALHGDMDRARAAMARFEVLEQKGITGAIDQTFAALARRNLEQAKEWMRRTIEKIGAQQPDPGAGYVVWLSANVMRDPALDEPEFVALREQLRGL